MLEVRLLGQFEVRIDGVVRTLPSRPAQSLLAYLVLHAGTPQRRELLAGLLWPDHPENVARRNLRAALWHVRKAVDGEKAGARAYILSDGITIGFDGRNEYWLDTAALEAGTATGAGGQCTSGELIDLVSLYRGELLPGFYEDWAILERERVEAVFEAAMQRLLGQLLAEERWDDALSWSRRWIALGHAPEPAYRVLMAAHACLGDQLSAAEAYRRCRAALNEEMGVEPSTQTLLLYEMIVKGNSPAGLATQVLSGMRAPVVKERPGGAADEAPVPGEPPFLGLHHFEEQDAALFFGREALVARLLARLQRDPSLLLLVGASGSGKSSLLRAGLVPAVRAARLASEGERPMTCRVFIITPTERPLEALAAALTRDAASATATTDLMEALAADRRSLHLAVRRLLAGDAERVLLVVDQLEELFTLCHDEAERRAFIENLVTAPEGSLPLTLVVALRADFYAHCGEYPGLREALAEHQEYIGPMSAAELRHAIEGPARQGGWTFSPGLVDLILRDAGDEPGALPLLSHALLETWKRREGHTLTLAGYAASGGVHAAIARTAERVCQGLRPAEQAIMRSIFLRLTALGEGTQDTRRRVNIAELVPTPELELLVREVLDALTAARLITVGDDAVDVAHEALIREWPSLRRWLAEDREGLRVHRRLTVAAQEWENLARDPSVLYRGTLLAQAAEWAGVHPDRLNETERGFLAAAREQAEVEAARSEAQRLRELEASRQLALAESQRAEAERKAGDRLRRAARYLASALAAAILLAVVAGFFAYESRVNAATASAARGQAERQRRLAIARELAAGSVSNLDVDPERSILLAMQAISTTYLADGSWTPEAETALHRAIARSRVLLALRPDGGPQLFGVSYSPDGRRLATAADDGRVIVWDAATGKQVLTLAGHNGPVESATFSPDGARIATCGDDNTVRVWDAQTGRQLQSLTGHTSWVGKVVFHPGGRMLATAGADGVTILWDLQSGKPLHELPGVPGGNGGVAFSPDGRLLAGGSADNTARTWDVATGEERGVYRGHTQPVGAVAFSPDGTRLVTGSVDFTAKVWDVATGREIVSLVNHKGLLFGTAFSPDGRRVLTASNDGTARVWDAATGRELFVLAGHEKLVSDAAFSPDGTQISTVSPDGTARIWTALPPVELALAAPAEPSGEAFEVALSPDGKQAATAGADGVVRIWDMATGRGLLRLPAGGRGAPQFAVAFSPDGKRLATSGQELEARVWDARTGELVLALKGHGRALVPDDYLFVGIQSITYSPDGRLIATAGADGTARIWDANTGEQLKVLTGHTGRLNSVRFSPDGKRLATASDDLTARIWDVASGEPLATLKAGNLRVWAAAFSPDGKWLATAGQDATAKIWDLATGREHLTLAGYAGTVRYLAFSPDGSRLATVAGSTAHVWDTSDGRELLTIDADNTTFWSIIFSRDGKQLLASDGDGGVHVYTLDVAELMRLAKRRVTRSLTTAECHKYLHVERCMQPPAD